MSLTRVTSCRGGIAGNRVLSDGQGVSALARFERDVLSEPGVTHVVLFVGINDIGVPKLQETPSLDYLKSYTTAGQGVARNVI